MCHDEPMSSQILRTDPLRVGDAVIVLPGHDPAAAEVYTHLLGDPSAPGRWAAENGSVAVIPGDEAAAGASVAFEAADVDAAVTLVARRGLSCERTGDFWRAVSVPAVALTADAGGRPGRPALDHVVYTAPTGDAAVALFAGRLGMDFRLVRAFGEVSQLFFRTRTMIVEVLVGGDWPAEFALWGLAWRCADLGVEHARLAERGLALSEVRTGRKPGTRVVTVREPGLGTPTILIEQSPRSS